MAATSDAVAEMLNVSVANLNEFLFRQSSGLSNLPKSNHPNGYNLCGLQVSFQTPSVFHRLVELSKKRTTYLAMLLHRAAVVVQFGFAQTGPCK